MFELLGRCVLVSLGLALAACSQLPPLTAPVPGDPITINQVPTGSIQVPSLCERVSTDTRVTHTGVDSFAFVWAGDHYVVVYADLTSQDIFVVQLGADGAPRSTPVAVEATPGSSRLPSIIVTPTGYVVAWEDQESEATVRVHALDLAAQPVGEGHTVATGRSAQMRPVLAGSPLGVAISWMDQAPLDLNNETDVGDSSTYVGVLDEQLALRAMPAPSQVHPKSRSGYPWLAGDAHGLGLLWSDNVSGQTDAYFSSVDDQMTLPAAQDVRGPDAVNAALLGRLALTDAGYLAAWEDLRSGETEIYTSVLAPTGERYAGGLVEEPNTGNANWPHIASGGSASAIVYYQYRGGRPQIFLTFIDANGARIGGSADAQISNTPARARFPDVAYTGNEFGVLWLDARDTTTELYFNHVDCKRPAPI